MKKVFAVLILFCLLVLAGLVVLPSFIDWNAYRGELAAMLGRATGQQVAINGDLEMAFLPSPHLNARDVRVANVAGALAPDLVRIGEIRMQIAAGPLFSGRVSISSLLLVEPVLTLETLPDGRGNWEIAAERKGEPVKPGALPVMPMQLSFEKVSVANGALAWHGADGGTQRLEKLNAQISAVDLAGPVRVESSASYKERPFTLNLSLGQRSPGAPVPVSARLTLGEGAGELSLTGTADLEARSIAGTANISAPNAADLAAALAGEAVGGAPPWPFSLESPIRLTAEAVQAGEVAVRLGKLDAAGEVSLAFGEVPRLRARLDISSLDVDELLAGAGAPETADPEDGQAGAQPARIPGGLDADIELTADILKWKGGIVRDAGLNAKLEDGVLSVERAGAQLPGGTTVTLSGKAVNHGQGARFDGDLAAISDNLRSALLWAGAEEESLPPDRLRAFSYTSRIAVLDESINLTEVTARLDATRITGAAVIARRERPSFGVSLQLDRIVLDDYLAYRGAAADNGAGGKDGGRRGIAGLDGLDANIDLAVRSLTWRGKPVSRFRLDAQLFNGELTLREAAAADFGGAALAVAGVIGDVAGAARATLDISLDGTDPESFTAFMGVEKPAFARRFGRFKAQGRLTGDMEKAEISVALDVAGGRVEAAGALSDLGGARPAYDLSLIVRHPDGDRVLALAMPGRRAGNAGPLEARLHMSGGEDALSFSEISGDLGGMAFSGALDVSLSGERPGLNAEIQTGAVMLDRLFPPAPPAAAGAPPVRGNARWSREPVDVSGLRDFDLVLVLQSEALVRREIRIEGVNTWMAVRGGIATLEKFTGTLFGGTLAATGRLDATGPAPALQGKLAAQDVESKALFEALGEFARFKGPVSLDMSARAAGRNEFELVSSLAGQGTVSGNVEARLKEGERAQAGAGALLGIVLGDKVRELGAAGDAVAVLVGAFAVEPAALSGDFTMDKGVARIENLLLDGKGARAVTAGRMDLANWTIDSNTAMYRDRDGKDPYLTLGLRGPLDMPDMRTGGSWLKRRPEAPAAQPAPQEPAAIPQAQPESEPKKPPKPEEFILDILKSLQ